MQRHDQCLYRPDPYAIVLSHGRSDRSAPALARPRRRLLAHHVHGDWGVRFPAGPRVSVHAIVAGEAHLWADAPRARAAAGARRHRARARVPAPPDAHRPGRRLHPVRRAPARPDGAVASSTATARRPSSSAAPTTSRATSAARRSTRCRRPSACARRPAARCARRWTCSAARCCSEAPGPAGAARPPARCRAGAGPARALRRDGHDAPGLVPRVSDPLVGAALRAMHAEPARQWTVADLAAEARCRARPSPGASPTSSGSDRSPT